MVYLVCRDIRAERNGAGDDVISAHLQLSSVENEAQTS